MRDFQTMSQATHIYEQAIEIVERFGKCITQEFKNQKEETNLNELANYILHFSNNIEINKARDKIFDETVNMVDSSSEQLNWEEVQCEFDEKIDNIKKSVNSKKNTRYKDFKALISEQNGDNDDGDDEIMTVCESINKIDPISQLPIKDPVRNKKCGHVYDKNTIFEFLAMNKKTKCPMAGCSVSETVSKNDLVPYPAFKRMLSNTSDVNVVKKKKKSS